MSRNTTTGGAAVAGAKANAKDASRKQSLEAQPSTSQQKGLGSYGSLTSSIPLQSESRPGSTVRSPTGGASGSRPTSQLAASTQQQQGQTPRYSYSASSSRSPTPCSSASSSRRNSVVLDSSAYRYSLNVGSISRFPPAPASPSGADQLRAATASGDRASPRIHINIEPHTRTKEEVDGLDPVGAVDPSRASVTSSSSRASSRVSSRYMAEEVAPQRRPVYLALPSDPSALGPWSSTTLSTAKTGRDHDTPSNATSKAKTQSESGGARRNSKIMTTFPFPHPVTPRRRADKQSGASTGARGSARLTALSSAWQRLLNAIFSGPYERQLLREEQEDDRITESIIEQIAQRNTPHPQQPSTHSTTTYGTLPLPSNSNPKATSTLASSEEEEERDPYGYRRMAGPHLLPSYTTDLVARRRERRRARSRARFQCMALWTICTVSILLLLIVAVLVFSFAFPDKLDIPSHHPDDHDDHIHIHALHMLNPLLLLLPTFAQSR